MEKLIENFGKISLWLNVAKDEIETIKSYTDMFGLLDETKQAEVRERLDEIIGDEFNHALISLLSASTALGIKIPTDSLDELMEQAFDHEDEEGE